MALCRIRGGSEEGGCVPEEIREAPLALLKVTASWCGPCKRVQPEFLRICGTCESVVAYVLDVDAAQKEGGDAQQLLDVLDISALPTFVGFRGGKEWGRVQGAMADDIEKLFASLVTAGSESPAEIEGAKVNAD